MKKRQGFIGLLIFILLLHNIQGIYVPSTSGQTKTKSALDMKTLGWQNVETTEAVKVYQDYANVKVQQHQNADNLKQIYLQNNNKQNNEQFDLEPSAMTPRSTGGGNPGIMSLDKVPSKGFGDDTRYGRKYPHGQSPADNDFAASGQTFQVQNPIPVDQPKITCTVNCRTEQTMPVQRTDAGTLYWAVDKPPNYNYQPQRPKPDYPESGFGGVTVQGTPYRPVSRPIGQHQGPQYPRPQHSYVRPRPATFTPLPPPRSPTRPTTAYQRPAPPQNVILPQNYYSGKIQNAPRQTQPIGKCPQGANGAFPYESSCNQFLSCWNGRGVVQNCAPGTLFNPETLECDFPEKVNCISGPRLAKYEKLTAKEHASCPEGFSGVVPHYQDCSKFLNCDNGRQNVMDCPPGTLFDQRLNLCDHAYKVQCVNQDRKETRFIASGRYTAPQYGQQDKVEEQQIVQISPGSYQSNNFGSGGGGGDGQNLKCPPGHAGVMPHPTDCSKFLNCGSGMTFVMNCGPGTHFSPTLLVCDHIHNVRCGAQGQGQGPEQYGQQPQSTPNYQTNWNQPQRQNRTQTYQNPTYQQWNPHPQQQGSPTYQGQHSGNSNPNPYQGTYQQPPQTVPIYQTQYIRPNQPTTNQNWNHTQYSQPTPRPFPNSQQNSHYTANPLRISVTTPDDDLDQKIQDVWHLGPEPTTSSYESLTTSYSENKRKPWPPPFPTNNPEDEYVFEYDDLVEIEPPKPKPPASGSQNTFVPTPIASSKITCTKEAFNCGDGYCISNSLVCNGKKDCPNNMDETDCGLRLKDFIKTSGAKLAVKEANKMTNVTLAWCAASCAKTNCKGFNFRKHDGTCYILDTNVGSSGALIILPMYDYYENQKFMINCEQVNGFLCQNQKCIPKSKLCDGVNDCGDAMDEKGCTADAFDYKLKLVGGDDAHSGRLELQVFGKTGYICDDMFGLKNADVACRELGFDLGAAEVRGNSYFAQDVPDNETVYLMDDVTCQGNESSLRDCDFNGWGNSNCKPQEIVGVICKTPLEICPKDHWQCKNNLECLPLAFVCDGVYDCADKSDEYPDLCDAPIKLRLSEGMKGRLEIMHNGIWGTVCDDDFNDDAAKVVCHQLGYTGSAKVVKDGHFGPGSGPIWLDQVFCRGNETLLEDCIHWDWGEHNCEHSEDVGVICNDKQLLGVVKHQNIDHFDEEDFKLPDKCGFRSDAIFNTQEDPEDAHFRVIMAGTARAGEYPWQASIRVRGKTKAAHWCGAIVLSSKYVLTAAHCLTGFSKGAYFIVAGDYNVDRDEGTEQEAYIEDFIIHPKFGHGNKMNNDIALVRLKGKGFTITKDVQPVCLPPADVEYPVGLNCTISGFGSIESGKSKASHELRAGWIPILSKEVCKMPHVYGAAITDGMLCAGFMQNGVDACDGDSGGPLACLHEGVFKVFGITSWGQHCGYANKPGVYVHVAKYRTWIEDTMKELANNL